MRRAVVDVGSNSVLWIIAEQSADRWQVIHEETRVTALGAGTKTTGLLSPEGAAKTLDALRIAFGQAREANADVVAGGTMALRIATDTPAWLAEAEAQGTPVRVLSGDEEADLGFRAVAGDPMLAGASRVSIVDPGGHSTELVTADRNGTGWDVKFRRSYAVGALGLRSQVWPEEIPTFAQRLNAVELVDQEIGLEYRPHTAGVAVALGATGTNLVTIREGMAEWQPDRVHGAILDFEEISKAVGWLCDQTEAQRRQIVGMEPGREGTLHAGALILERFLNALHVLDCRVSVRGWRHALLEDETYWTGRKAT